MYYLTKSIYRKRHYIYPDLLYNVFPKYFKCCRAIFRLAPIKLVVFLFLVFRRSDRKIKADAVEF